VTRDDRRRGRRQAPTPSPVKAVALASGVPVFTEIDAVTKSGAELGVVVAYGKLIPGSVFSVMPLINIHFSLLPRWRGAAPVQRAILAGDEVTGVCLMAIDAGLDTGPIYARREVRIGEEETADGLEARLGDIGTSLLLQLLAEPGELPMPTPQSGEATVAPKVSKEELHLDFARPAEELARVVRLGGAWTTFRGRRLIIWRAVARPRACVADRSGVLAGDLVQCGEGALELSEVQSEGRATLGFRAWAAGVRIGSNEALGESGHSRETKKDGA
jgi:methionyl-tRNA formyltransferase